MQIAYATYYYKFFKIVYDKIKYNIRKLLYLEKIKVSMLKMLPLGKNKGISCPKFI
jgi:hypothetical protein